MAQRYQGTDPILTDISLGYQNAAYIAEEILPTLPVKHQSGKHFVYDKGKFRSEDSMRGPGARSREVTHNITTGLTYLCEDHALKEFVTDEDVDNAPAGVHPYVDATESLGGMISNLQDSWNLFLAGEGQKLLEWAKQFVTVVQLIITDVLPVWIDRIDKLIQFFKDHETAIYIVAGAIVGALTPAIIAAAAAFGALALTLAPWIIGGAIIGGLVAGMVYVAKNWDTIWEGIKNDFKAAINFLIGIAEGWANSWVNAANVIIDALNKVKFSIPSWVPGIGGKSFGINIPRVEPVKLPRLEHGGVVPGPVGTAVPIIAHGQETVLPASRSERGSAPIITVNINNPSVRSRADVEDMRLQIEAALRDVVRVHKLAAGRSAAETSAVSVAVCNPVPRGVRRMHTSDFFKKR